MPVGEPVHRKVAHYLVKWLDHSILCQSRSFRVRDERLDLKSPRHDCLHVRRRRTRFATNDATLPHRVASGACLVELPHRRLWLSIHCRIPLLHEGLNGFLASEPAEDRLDHVEALLLDLHVDALLRF